MSSKTASSIPAIPPHRDDIEVHESAGGATLFDPRTSNMLRLNATALEIWKQCDGSKRAADIAARLTELFEVSLAESQKHVDRMIQELHSLNMLVADEAAISEIHFEST